MSEFFREVGSVRVIKVDKDVPRLKRLRLYCEQAGAWWNLQVRGPLLLANGSEGKDFVVATATLYPADMVALRDEIEDLCGPGPEPKRKAELFDRALAALLALRDAAPCQNGCPRGDPTCASEAARVVLHDARELGYLPPEG